MAVRDTKDIRRAYSKYNILSVCLLETRQIKSKNGKVFPVLQLIKHYAMKTYGGVDV
jgi:hypothetical protein